MKNIYYALFFSVLASVTQAQNWQNIKAMPGGGRDAGVAFTIGNMIYSGGGQKKDFYQYDIQANTWTKKADIPGVTVNRGFAVGFSINGKGYVGMGTDQNTSALKNDLWEYDPLLNIWSQKANFPGGNRDGLGVFVINNKAYIGGGADASFHIYQDFYEYDPAIDKWTQKGNLGSGFTIFPAMFSIGNYGYLTCGAGQSEFTDLFRYDPRTDYWNSMSPFPEDSARQACVAFVLGEKGYVGLGQRNYDTAFTAMCVYDPVKDEWKKITNIPGKGRGWATAAVIGNNAYIGNGWDFVDNFFSDWWSFTPADADVKNSSSSKENSVNCFPNPVSKRLQFSGLTEGQNYFITVSDVLGREVIRISQRSESSLDVNALRSGTYTIVVGDGTKITTMKFLKE